MSDEWWWVRMTDERPHREYDVEVDAYAGPIIRYRWRKHGTEDAWTEGIPPTWTRH